MLAVRSTRVVLPEGKRAAALHIGNGVIECIVEYASEASTTRTTCSSPPISRLA
jgi:hypothetical protein